MHLSDDERSAASETAQRPEARSAASEHPTAAGGIDHAESSRRAAGQAGRQTRLVHARMPQGLEAFHTAAQVDLRVVEQLETQGVTPGSAAGRKRYDH